jgi:hypothetical protein
MEAFRSCHRLRPQRAAALPVFSVMLHVPMPLVARSGWPSLKTLSANLRSSGAAGVS